VSEIDFRRFDVLTFDCYGTLIDWERGILDALQPILAPQGIEADEEELLESYARHEAALEAGEYVSYREIVATSVQRLCSDFGFSPSAEGIADFADSVGVWPAFRDTAPALLRLARRFSLGVITNCDDDLFARSNKRLGVIFDWIVTAQMAYSYKPSLNNFRLALDLIEAPTERILHVAQSLYHDHVPAKQLGMTTAWINRRQGRPGSGATPQATASADLSVPDMRTFAELACQ
jgi:2-haloacid dehalogenase